MSRKNTVTIAIACGSGICTSGVAKAKIENLAASINVPVSVITCNGSELQNYIGDIDIVLTVMPYSFPEDVKYAMNVFPLITGIGAASCEGTLKEWINELHE